MRCFKFTSEWDDQGRLKPLTIGGSQYLFPGCASYGEFSAYIDALISELDGPVRAEAQKYFATKRPVGPKGASDA